ncbi:hypothetical protein J6590_039428 [Homalodisca vitripennis]|nr:hypothetical protein J6590_039428 [Homalodisca vitripennis]
MRRGGRPGFKVCFWGILVRSQMCGDFGNQLTVFQEKPMRIGMYVRRTTQNKP